MIELKSKDSVPFCVVGISWREEAPSNLAGTAMSTQKKSTVKLNNYQAELVSACVVLSLFCVTDAITETLLGITDNIVCTVSERASSHHTFKHCDQQLRYAMGHLACL